MNASFVVPASHERHSAQKQQYSPMNSDLNGLNKLLKDDSMARRRARVSLVGAADSEIDLGGFECRQKRHTGPLECTIQISRMLST